MITQNDIIKTVISNFGDTNVENITVLYDQYHVARGNIYSYRNHLALQSNAPLISPLHLLSSKIK